MNENELRRALQSRVPEVLVNRDRLRRAQVEAAHRRRRRDVVKAAGFSSVASILAVVGVFSLSGLLDPRPMPNAADAAASIDLAARIESSEPSADTAAASARTGTLVAAGASGRLVLLDPVTGKTIRALTTVTKPEAPSQGALIGHVAIDTVGQQVYFDASGGDACESEIRATPLEGGTSNLLVIGSTPAVSSDGKSLAYVQNGTCGSAPIVKIRDLLDGSERTVATAVVSGADSPKSVAQLSFSPDGSRLLADIRHSESFRNRLVVFDSTREQSITEGVVLAGNDPATVYEWGSYLPDGRIFLSERCCADADNETVSNQSSRMIVVDPNAPGSTLISYGIVTKSHTATVADATGKHLAYLSGTDLMVSDNSGRPSAISFGLIGLDWR